MYRLWLLSLVAVLPLNAAALRTRSVEIPNAFEANQGQSPAQFQYLVTHRNIGFSCRGIYWGRIFPPRPDIILAEIRIAGATAGCASELIDADGSHSIYYRGRNAAGAIGPLPRFRRLRFSLPQAQVEYTGERDHILAAFTFPGAAPLRSLRLLWDEFGSADGRGDTIFTSAGAWKVRSSRGIARAVPAPDNHSVGFEFEDTGSPNAPVTLILEMPTAPVSPTTTTATVAATQDRAGNVYLTGHTTAYSQFDPSARACSESTFTERCPDAYLARFDAGSRLNYLVYLLGDSLDGGTNIAVDAEDGVYVGGITYSSDFVTTPGVLQEGYSGPVSQAVPRRRFGGDVFLAKLEGRSGRLIYSTYLGLERAESLADLQVDALARTYLRVGSQSPGFPAWGDPVVEEDTCSRPPFSLEDTCSFFLSLDSFGAGVRFSKPMMSNPRVTASGAAYLPSRRISADGDLESLIEIPEGLENARLFDAGTDGTLWVAASGPTGGILARAAPQSNALEIVNDRLPPIEEMRLDAEGYLWLLIPASAFMGAGLPSAPFTPTPDAPLQFPCDRCAGLMRVAPNGTLVFATYLPAESNARLVGGALLWGQASATVHSIDFDASAAPLIASVEDTSAPFAEYLAGNVLTVLGAAIGPAQPAVNPRNNDGSAATETGGVRVLVDGRASPILSASRNRITFMVSHQTPVNGSGWLVIEHAGKPVVTTPVSFGGRGFAILSGPFAPPGTGIFNEDGSVNSRENPARPGSVIRFHFVAAGPFDQPLVDGQTQHTVLSRPVAPVQIHLSLGSPAGLLSLAQAPGELAGYIEARVRIPASPPPGLDATTPLTIVPFVRGAPILHMRNHVVFVARVQP